MYPSVSQEFLTQLPEFWHGCLEHISLKNEIYCDVATYYTRKQRNNHPNMLQGISKTFDNA